MNEVLTPSEVQTVTPRRRVNGSAGAVQIQGKPPTLARLRGKGREVVVEWEGTRVKLSYNRESLSMKDWRMIREADRDEDSEEHKIGWVVPALCRIVQGWDLLADEDASHPLPINSETLEDLPMNFLLKMVNTIFGDIDPPEVATSSGSF